MKKFTLTLAACAVVFSGMAQSNAVSGIPAQLKEKAALLKKETKMLENLKTFYPKAGAVTASDIVAPKSMQKKFSAPALAEGEDQTMNEYNGYMFGLYFEEALGGTVERSMLEMPFATAVQDGNEFILLDVWGFEPLLGMIVPGENSMSAYGADSIVFVNNYEVASLQSSGTPVNAAATRLYRNESNEVVGERIADLQFFGGYYYRQYNQIALPTYIGLYAGETTTPIDGYTYGYMDILSGVENAMVKASFTGIDDEKSPIGMENTAAVFVFNDLYVKGLDPNEEDLWIKIDTGSDNPEQPKSAGIYEQYINTYQFTNGAVAPVFLEPALASFDDRKLTQWTEYIPIYSETDLDDNLIVGFDGNNVAVDYALGLGWLDFFGNVEIVITNEFIANGIKGVSTESAKVAAKEYFDLSGRKVESTAKGLVIEKVRYTDGKTVSRKVVK
ncbi:MAG: hypothetical protein K2L56_01605 [Prevotella sp.]|nr:hypothetical protein [Prevotella sp.]